MSERNLPPEFWPEAMERDGDIITRREMDAAWRLWVSAGDRLEASRLEGALGRAASSVSRSPWPWSRVADAMRQRARKAGVIRPMKGVRGAWEFTEAYLGGDDA